MSLAFDAMMFAREVHRYQRRKYTGNPYSDHLSEVAGIASTVAIDNFFDGVDVETVISVAYLHDAIEDQNITVHQLTGMFGAVIAQGVLLLSDLETGTRSTRKALSRARLAAAPGWIQSIKCADIISNTSSVVKHDPEFAALYLKEKRLLLDIMTNADPRLHALARQQAEAA